MAERKLKRMSGDEFLAWQLGQEKLYELVDGHPLLPLKMMTGATLRHDRAVVNLIMVLGNQLRRGGCRPTTADVAIRIPAGNMRRPDVMIDCGTPTSDREMTAVDPRVVIEVLSPSTLSFDRFRKLEEYKTVPSLSIILLVDTEAPQVTVYRRRGEFWDFETVEGTDAVIELDAIGARLALSDLYEGIAFGA
jgi:Uma2 family endonuclease